MNNFIAIITPFLSKLIFQIFIINVANHKYGHKNCEKGVINKEKSEIHNTLI